MVVAYQDRELVTLEFLIEDVNCENINQLKKWGVQTHTLAEWMLFLTEEVGELAEAIGEHVYRVGLADDIQHEAIQVATLALKIAEIAKEAQL